MPAAALGGTPSAADLNLRPSHGSLDRQVRLPDPDLDLTDREANQDFVGNCLGDRLDEAEAGGLHDAPADLEYRAVIDGLVQVIVHAGRLKVEHQVDVDVERLSHVLLMVVHAVAAHEHHVVESDNVGHRAAGSSTDWPRRTTASAMRATRTFGSTSWTRTI